MRLSVGAVANDEEDGSSESLIGGQTREHARRGSLLIERALASLPRMSPFHAGVCLLLSLQNSSYVLLRRYSSGVLHEAASAQAILAVGEMIKLAFSWYMVMRDAVSSDLKSDAELELGTASSGKSPTTAAGRVCRPRWFIDTSSRLLLSSAVMAVPAFIFLAMNLLSFVALERISASSFTLIQQTKIIFTAFLSRVLLGKILSASRWRALLCLLFAILIICQQTQPKPTCHSQPMEGAPNMQRAADGCTPSASDEVEWHAYAVGVAAVTTEAVRRCTTASVGIRSKRPDAATLVTVDRCFRLYQTCTSRR
eukprot:scaffold93832_cov31-Tisochrysis_lutea.AAC.5